jgi:hypothetical protein
MQWRGSRPSSLLPPTSTKRARPTSSDAFSATAKQVPARDRSALSEVVQGESGIHPRAGWRWRRRSHEGGMTVLPADFDTTAAASPDRVPTNDGPGAADGRVSMPRRMPDQRARTITLPATRLPRPSRFQPPPAVAEAAVGGDHVWVPTDEDAFRVAGAAVAAHLIAVRFHQDPGVRVACEPVPRDQDFG